MTSVYDAGNGAPALVPDDWADPAPTDADRARHLAPGDRHLRLGLDPTLAAPELARQAVAAWQARLDLDPRLNADVIIMVQELVTNAVLHGRSRSEVVASIEEDVVRLEVHDLGADTPVLRPHDGNNNGNGLHVVAGIADRWGWRPTRTGKYVWTENDVVGGPDDRHAS